MRTGCDDIPNMSETNINGCENSPKFDPWAPPTTIKPILMPRIPDPRQDFKSSEDYIASLEAKLKKLKSNSGKKASKDMIDSLCQVKEDHMKHLTDGTANSFIDNYDDEIEEKHSRIAQLQRRLIPEQALSSEELKVLVENDELGKLMEELMAEMEQEREILKHEENKLTEKKELPDSACVNQSSTQMISDQFSHENMKNIQDTQNMEVPTNETDNSRKIDTNVGT